MTRIINLFDPYSPLCNAEGWIAGLAKDRFEVDTAHNPSVIHVRHAVSIDERRACFGPNLFFPKDAGQHESFLQVWFPGVHADVGGGYPEEEAGLAKIALEWMLHEADAHGLRLNKTTATELLGANKQYCKPNALAPLRKIDMAIGYSLRDNFCKSYRFLVRNYVPGDQVFLFGFSRGAYTVRALAGAIHRQGLVRPELESLAEYAWAAYSNDMHDLDERAMFRADARFAKYFSLDHDIRIHFVGVFDTVSSFGWIWDYRTLPAGDGDFDDCDACRLQAVRVDGLCECAGCLEGLPGGVMSCEGVNPWYHWRAC
jgi:uncharacterized protein (DUF2235 family)